MSYEIKCLHRDSAIVSRRDIVMSTWQISTEHFNSPGNSIERTR